MLAPGTRLGPYEITAQIGVGGMGEVYRATDTNLKRAVAIKVLPASVVADAERLARFQREAEVLASLNHPHIAAIYGLERSGATTALVMELVEGPTLADRIAQGAIPIDEALPIAKQIAEALEAAHEQGIIHRDLKPANIKVRPDGTVKVLDFGLAKAMEPPRGSSPSVSQSPTITSPAMMTGVGMILGTAAYMSPEQARGTAVDKRADIWAFGVVLFEVMTGARPFEGETVSDTMASVLKSEPHWTALPAGVPSTLRRLLTLCLKKDPKARLRDIGEARRQLEELLGGMAEEPVPPTVVPPASRRRERVWMGVSAVMALGAIALGGWMVSRPVAVTAPVQFVVLPPDGEQFASGPGLLSLSPDGRRLAFVTQSGGKQMLWVRPLDSVSAQVLPGTDDAWQPSWSPDSRYVAFGPLLDGRGKLKRIDVSGGRPSVLADSTKNFTAWSSSGVILANDAKLRLVRTPENGGAPIHVTEIDESRHETGHSWPVFLPDGRRFIFLAASSDPSQSALYLGSIDSPERTHLVDAFSSVGYGSGYLLYQRDGTLMAQPFDEHNGRVIGERVPLIEGVAYNPANGRAAFSVSTNGVLAFRKGTASGSARLTWFDLTGKAVGTLGPEGGYYFPRLSPDGRTVVVARRDVDDTEDLWTIDVDRGVPSRFTFDAAVEDNPIWSPDGTQVVFRSNRKGRFDLYQRALGGGAAEDELLFESPEQKVPTGFSPDGKVLLFQRFDTRTQYDIWALPMTGDRKPFAVVSTPFSQGQATFSPDGRWIAYESNETGLNEVYVQPFPSTGAKVRLSQTTGNAPQWSADGKTVFYSTSDLRFMAVDVAAAANGELRVSTPRELFEYQRYLSQVDPGNWGVDTPRQRLLLPVTSQAQDAPPITVVLNWPELLKK